MEIRSLGSFKCHHGSMMSPMQLFPQKQNSFTVAELPCQGEKSHDPSTVYLIAQL